MDNQISVIVPVYNVPEKLLRNCLNSLMRQEGKDIEFVIVDDGSKDDSGKVCDEYAEKDNRFKVIHQQNKGLSGARNTGVNNVESKWFMFVDGDDYLEENSIANLRRYLDRDVDVIVFGTIKHYSTKTMLYDYNKRFKHEYIYDKKYMLDSILNFRCQIEDAPAKLYNTEFIKTKNIYHDEKLKKGIEGLEYTFRVFLNANRTLYLNEYYYNYEYNNQSITITDTGGTLGYLEYGFGKIKENIKEYNVNYLIDAYYNRILYIIVGGAISVYFSPNNQKKYKEKVKGFKQYLKTPFIKEGLKKGKTKKLDIKRKIIIMLIKIKWFFPLTLLAKIRRNQKER